MINRLPLLMVIAAILLLLDFYLSGAVRSVSRKWSGKYRKLFNTIWWGTSLLVISGVFLSIFFNFNFGVRSVMLVAFFLTFIAKVILLLFVIADDLRRAAIFLVQKFLVKKTSREKTSALPGDRIPRSEFLIKAGIVLAAVPAASLLYGTATGVYDYRVKRRQLVLPNLPKAFEGMTIGQISDIHSGSFYNQKAVKGGVDLLLAEKADVIFFTGDLVNRMANEMREYQDIFAKVKAPLGVFSILGNHDYGDYGQFDGQPGAKQKNFNDLVATHKSMGWDLLRNEHRKLTVNGESIGILGSENWGAGRFAKYGDMTRTVTGTEDVPVKLLLSHDPSHWRAQILKDYPDIDMMFSGHTHGMQFGVRVDALQWSPAQYIYPEWAGFYSEGPQQLYVNVGYGFLGYPGRVGILPEITIFELQRS